MTQVVIQAVTIDLLSSGDWQPLRSFYAILFKEFCDDLSNLSVSLMGHIFTFLCMFMTPDMHKESYLQILDL